MSSDVIDKLTTDASGRLYELPDDYLPIGIVTPDGYVSVPTTTGHRLAGLC